ncbi:MAG: OsmC family protein [bacterium]|nr:OsmC family protein [bacterium]
MKALLRHTGQMAFLAKADSNHWVPVDAGPPSGGGNAATAPIELLVIAAGGCVSMDMVHIFGKSRKPFTRFDMEVEATRAETHPRRLLSLHFHAQVEGPEMTPDAIEKAINLSLTKYCSVSLSLDRAVTFHASYTCNGVPGQEWQVERNMELYG